MNNGKSILDVLIIVSAILRVVATIAQTYYAIRTAAKVDKEQYQGYSKSEH